MRARNYCLGAQLYGTQLLLDRILNRRVEKDFFEYAALLKTKSDVSDKEIFEAARQANAYDFIENLPGKWNSQVGEGPFLNLSVENFRPRQISLKSAKFKTRRKAERRFRADRNSESPSLARSSEIQKSSFLMRQGSK